MKKINFLSFLCVSFLTIFTLCVYQAIANSGWNKHVWPEYKIQFLLPGDFEIKEKTNDVFQAKNNSMIFSMYPWNAPKLNAKSMTEFAIKYLELDYSESKLTHKEIKLKNLKGYEISGTGKDENGEKAFVIIGLTDLNGNKNFTAYIIFDPGEHLDNADIAMHLIDNISKM
jgi:hypothetical protein